MSARLVAAIRTTRWAVSKGAGAGAGAVPVAVLPGSATAAPLPPAALLATLADRRRLVSRITPARRHWVQRPVTERD